MVSVKELSWKTDKNGIVTGVRYHDGNILAYSFSQNTCSVQVRDVDGGIADFQLSGIEDWTVEFWNWPIVSYISIWPVNSAPHNLDCWKDLYGSRAKDFEKVITNCVKENPELFLFHIDCSYGGLLAAVCKEIKVFQLQ